MLDSLPLGSLSFEGPELTPLSTIEKWTEFTAPAVLGPLNEWRENYPRWRDPDVWARGPIGDAYALRADELLTLAQPFPGDEQFNTEDVRPELRFRIVRSVESSEYLIRDYLSRAYRPHLDTEIYISTDSTGRVGILGVGRKSRKF